MFLALFSPGHSVSLIRTFSPFLFVTLDNATYNWPWQNTCLDKYMPTLLRDWPWLLLIVIAKQTDRGYCLLFSTNGHFESFGDMTILGMYTFSPTWVPVIIFASMYLFPSWVIVIRVPLHRPADWLMFRRSTTGMPTLSLSSWFGIPGNFKLFRNSVGYIWFMLLLFVDALHTLSELCALKAWKRRGPHDTCQRMQLKNAESSMVDMVTWTAVGFLNYLPSMFLHALIKETYWLSMCGTAYCIP